MAAHNRPELIARYRQGASVLAATVAGMSDAELDRKPADGGWSAREIVHHTADSELTSAVRLRLLLAEDNPEIRGYDQEQFSRVLHYGTRPVQGSLDAIGAARESTASILDLLTEEDWERSGTHSESGPYSVDRWLETYSAHCHDHAEQILRIER